MENLTKSIATWEASKRPMLDLRECPTQWLAHNYWIPVSQLQDRLYELPDRDTELHALLDNQPLNGNQPVDVAPAISSPTKAARIMDLKSLPPMHEDTITGLQARGWNVTVFYDSPDFWMAIEKCGLSRLQEAPKLTPIFRPCNLLEQYMDEIESALHVSRIGKELTCIDFGCGSGRDISWMCARGSGLSELWNCIGIDNMPASLKRGKMLADRYGISSRMSWIQGHIDPPDRIGLMHDPRNLNVDPEAGSHRKPRLFRPVRDVLPQCDLILNVRILLRGSWESLMELVRPGGFFLSFTFEDGVQNSAIGRPSDREHIIDIGELKQKLKQLEEGSDYSYRIIHDSTWMLGDGRPMNAFLAQKGGTPPANSPANSGNNNGNNGAASSGNSWSSLDFSSALSTFNVVADTYGQGNRAFVQDPAGSGAMVLQVTGAGIQKDLLLEAPGYILCGSDRYIQSNTQVQLDYQWMPEANFNFVMGGKLPGLFGGRKSCSGGDKAVDCFSTRYMFRQEGLGEAYLYVNQKLQAPGYCNVPPKTVCNPNYGDSLGRGAFVFQTGQWNSLRQVITLNTFSGSQYNKDGKIAVYFGGNYNAPVIYFDQVVWRTLPDVGFVGIDFETFFGGSSDTYITPTTQKSYFKGFQLTVLA
ncbi:hypothetical protein BJ742DRAFT_885415 [Cladochytrium replicatum]|nr:hypothetical protein BJ742DRAFT_885415 [Cladochytrium replicatum]